MSDSDPQMPSEHVQIDDRTVHRAATILYRGDPAQARLPRDSPTVLTCTAPCRYEITERGRSVITASAVKKALLNASSPEQDRSLNDRVDDLLLPEVSSDVGRAALGTVGQHAAGKHIDAITDKYVIQDHRAEGSRTLVGAREEWPEPPQTPTLTKVHAFTFTYEPADLWVAEAKVQEIGPDEPVLLAEGSLSEIHLVGWVPGSVVRHARRELSPKGIRNRVVDRSTLRPMSELSNRF